MNDHMRPFTDRLRFMFTCDNEKCVPVFSCVFVTVTVVDQGLCWLGRKNKRT